MYFSWRVFRFVSLQRVKKSKDRLALFSRSFWTRSAPGKYFSGVKSLGQNLEIQNFQLPFVDLCTVVKIYYLMWALVEHFQLLGLISFLQSLSKALSSPTYSFVFVFWFYIASSDFFFLSKPCFHYCKIYIGRSGLISVVFAFILPHHLFHLKPQFFTMFCWWN